MKSWLDGCSAQGGGDCPEAVADALHDMLKLSWRENATKICVLISDAPPHGLSPNGDGFPNGCPVGLDPMDIVRELAAKGITLYSVGCEPAINQYKEFFTAIAYLTGGQYIPLRGAKALTQVIIGGAQEEISLERWMAEVDEEVQREIAVGNQINDDEMTRRVQAKMNSKGIRGKKLQRNNLDLEAASASSKQLAGFTNMADVRSNFKETSVLDSRGGAAFPASVRMAPMAMAAPPVMETRETTNMDSWNTVESSISYDQASRMVQKSKSRQNYMS
ncbi:ariadne-like RING finger protein R811 [Mizuhopecten yessoensis]|uniref:Ariadne-like RING finger protein R811 n=1 Tax=Mizuhopecten yessoensis TaxID=6573 RepID=A0A210QFD9_MIZYE|nr:ariadne-like RING finger protein R811 [Mizuhopecten yessoensis]